MPWFQIKYKHLNGMLTEITSSAHEAKSAEEALFREKYNLCSGDLDNPDEVPSTLELEASYFALRKRLSWDGDLIAIEVAPPPPRRQTFKPRIIAARSSQA